MRFLDTTALVFCTAAASWVVVGCATRPLLIAQGAQINNASHRDLSERDRGSEPLEVSIVCVLPEDFENAVNFALKPGQGITCRDWYEHRPTGAADGVRFELPRSQIYVLTDRPQSDVYGQKKGSSLKGSAAGGRSVVPVSGIRCAGKLFRGGAVMYVFPRFIDKDGRELGVAPVMFRSGRAHTKELSVEIGVHTEDIRNPSRHYGQYIQDTSQRPRDNASGD